MSSPSKLENYITSLTDHELAIFIGYRFNGFMTGSQNKIINEAKKRSLAKDKLVDLFNRKLNSDLRDEKNLCPRCGSERLFTETDFELREHDMGGYEVTIDTKRCRLCGFNSDKETPKNLLEWIKKKFVNNKTERIVNWYQF